MNWAEEYANALAWDDEKHRGLLDTWAYEMEAMLKNDVVTVEMPIEECGGTE